MQSRSLPVPLYNRHIRTLFMEGMDETINGQGLVYKDVANTRPLENPNDLINTFTGGGYYSQHGEWQTADLYEPKNGWQLGFSPLIFKSGFAVNKYMKAWGDRGWISDQVKMLGAYGIHSLDQLFVNLFNTGFDSNYKTYDGQPLFSVSHPYKNSAGVFANRPATPSLLDQSTLTEAEVYFSDMYTDDGIPYSMDAWMILVHPQGVPNAKQVMGSPTQIGQNNAAVPRVPDANYALRKSGKLVLTKAWYVLAKPSPLKGMGHGLSLYFPPEGMPTTYTKTTTDPTGVKYIGEFWVCAVVEKVRGVWGNPGQ